MTCIANQDLTNWQGWRLQSLRNNYNRWVSHQNNVRMAEAKPNLTYVEKLNYIKSLYENLNTRLRHFEVEIDISWDIFRAYMFEPVPKSKWRPAYWNIPQCPYRNGNSYRKNRGHQPKKIGKSEENSWAWRQHKRIEKDKAKCSWKRSCPRSIRRYCNRKRRMWIKRTIYRGNWDELAQGNHDYKKYVDRWLWD